MQGQREVLLALVAVYGQEHQAPSLRYQPVQPLSNWCVEGDWVERGVEHVGVHTLQAWEGLTEDPGSKAAVDQHAVGHAGGGLLKPVQRGSVATLQERAARGEELVREVAVEEDLLPVACQAKHGDACRHLRDGQASAKERKQEV